MRCLPAMCRMGIRKHCQGELANYMGLQSAAGQAACLMSALEDLGVGSRERRRSGVARGVAGRQPQAVRRFLELRCAPPAQSNELMHVMLLVRSLRALFTSQHGSDQGVEGAHRPPRIRTKPILHRRQHLFRAYSRTTRLSSILAALASTLWCLWFRCDADGHEHLGTTATCIVMQRPICVQLTGCDHDALACQNITWRMQV